MVDFGGSFLILRGNADVLPGSHSATQPLKILSGWVADTKKA